MDKRKESIISKNYNRLKPEDFNVFDLKIFHFDENSNLVEKIISKKANIKKKNGSWVKLKFTKLKMVFLRKNLLSH